MQRRPAIRALAVLVVTGAAGFWTLTSNRALPADALKPRTADLANGAMMFSVGGWATCHATPIKDAKA